VDQLRGAGAVSTESVDVSNPESVVTATENTIVKHGKIEILVASAGIAGPNYKTWEYPIDAWKQIVDIDPAEDL
jgi:2-dehydro-3-deoxy-L-rhamnonate dehydrogenase (NAD+)